MFVLRTNHTFVLRINLVVLRITTRGVLSVIFDSLQVSIDPRHARCPNLNPFDPGRFPYFPDGRVCNEPYQALVQCRVCNEPYQASRKESDDKALSFDDAVLADFSLRSGAAHA